jgi:deoxycytidylate deaminase
MSTVHSKPTKSLRKEYISATPTTGRSSGSTHKLRLHSVTIATHTDTKLPTAQYSHGVDDAVMNMKQENAKLQCPSVSTVMKIMKHGVSSVMYEQQRESEEERSWKDYQFFLMK